MKLEPLKVTAFTQEHLPSWYDLAIQDLINIGLPYRASLGTTSTVSVSPYSDLMASMYDLPESYALAVIETSPIPSAVYLYENARCLAFLTEEQRYLFMYKAGQLGIAIPATIVLNKTTPRLTTNVSTKNVGILMPTVRESPHMDTFMRYASHVDYSDVLFLCYGEVEGPVTINLLNEDETSHPDNAMRFVVTLDAHEPSPVLCQDFPVLYADHYLPRLSQDATDRTFCDMLEEVRLFHDVLAPSDIKNFYRL